MIQENVSLQYRNVISKKYKFHYTKAQECMENFITTTKDQGMKISGGLFYSICNINKEAETEMEFFVPVLNKTTLPDESYRFHSYYSVENMISEVITADFEERMEFAYAKLIQYATDNKMEMISPIYNEVHKYKNKAFIVVKVAVKRR